MATYGVIEGIRTDGASSSQKGNGSQWQKSKNNVQRYRRGENNFYGLSQSPFRIIRILDYLLVLGILYSIYNCIQEMPMKKVAVAVTEEMQIQKKKRRKEDWLVQLRQQEFQFENIFLVMKVKIVLHAPPNIRLLSAIPLSKFFPILSINKSQSF